MSRNLWAIKKVGIAMKKSKNVVCEFKNLQGKKSSILKKIESTSRGEPLQTSFHNERESIS